MRGHGKQNGFTLVELIMVIVIAGLLAIGSVQFVGQATQGYADAANRQQLATIGWIASEKVSRELRNALPNSLRLNVISGQGGSCIEFVPIVSGSHYQTLPISIASDNFEIIAMPPSYAHDNGQRVAVYPSTTTEVYAQIPQGPVSVPTVASVTATTLQLSGGHRFTTDSPERRFFITENPVTYCFVGARLNRYSGYGFNSSFAIPNNPQIIVDKVQNGSFSIAPATLTRNAIVTMHLVLEDGATHTVDQEVQIRNVP